MFAMTAEEGVLKTPGTGQVKCKERAATAARAAEVPFTQEWQAVGEGAMADYLILLVQQVKDDDAVDGAASVAAHEPLCLEMLPPPDQVGGQDDRRERCLYLEQVGVGAGRPV